MVDDVLIIGHVHRKISFLGKMSSGRSRMEIKFETVVVIDLVEASPVSVARWLFALPLIFF